MSVLTGVLRMGAFAVRAAPLFWERVSADRKRAILSPLHRPQPASWADVGLHAAWLGHSTVLLKIDGITIITDPVFSSRIGLAFGPVTVGLKRIVAPALGLTESPQPDLILLSHAHMDHFDLPSLRALESSNTTVVTAAKTSDLLRVKGYSAVHELAWGESVQAGDIRVQAFEVNHWGARMQRDTWRGYNGYVIESPRFRVLFAGDTALAGTFQALHTARGFDLAIMPIGAYDPWIHAHYHKTFELSREPYNQPIERLESALGTSSDRLALREIGQEFSRF